MMGRRWVGVGMVLVLVAGTTGCETMKRKFIRKPKVVKAPEPIFALEQTYRPEFPPEVRYGAHFAYWKAAHDDLLSGLETATRMRRERAARQAIKELKGMQALLEGPTADGLGQVYHTRVWGGHIMGYPWGRYHHRRQMSFGGVLAATTVHPLDAVYWILGAPEPVTASASTFRRLDRMPDPPIHFEGTARDATVEDFGHAHVRFADGSSMSIEGNWLQHPRTRSHGWEIHGVRGVVQDVEPYATRERQSEVIPIPLEIAPEPADRTQAEHEAFVAAIRGERAPEVSWREALGVQRILAGIYASAEAGAEVGL